MSPTFAIFVFASLILAITPGPAVIFLVTRTLSQGRRVGLSSIGGVALGNFGNATIAALGPSFGKLLGWRSYGRYVTATTFIALGAYVAFGGANRSSAARGQ